MMETGRFLAISSPKFICQLDLNYLMNSIIELNGWQLSFVIIAPTRVFSKCTRMAIMAILASEALFRENKKNSVTKCYPSEY